MLEPWEAVLELILPALVLPLVPFAIAALVGVSVLSCGCCCCPIDIVERISGNTSADVVVDLLPFSATGMLPLSTVAVLPPFALTGVNGVHPI